MTEVPFNTRSTEERYSPHDQLPAPLPKDTNYKSRHFYENTAKFLIKDTVRIMMNGIAIDLNKVSDLEEVLVKQLQTVTDGLAENKIVREFQLIQHKKLVQEYIELKQSRLRDAEYYLKQFKHSDPTHRSYFMHVYSKDKNIGSPSELLPTGIPKWSASLVKTLSKNSILLQQLLKGEVKDTHPIAKEAMGLLAQHKAELYNKSYLDEIANPDLEVPAFNPGSATQKQELFDWLGIESDEVSKKTKKFKWGRKNIEVVLKTTDDEDIKDFIQLFIDHSYAAIVKNNFIEAFYNYTVDGRLYGQLKLLGALSGRYTSSNPNLLNAPSTGSIFAKPIKRCFVAPKNKVIISVDYSSLEDRVLASLTNDPGKCAIYEEGIDGHSYNACGYFRDEVAKHIELTDDPIENAKRFFAAKEAGNEELNKLRNKSKNITFKLAYLGMADAHKGGKITQDMYNNYHTNLYPNIMKQVDEYILPTVKQFGEIHLGLGFTLQSDDAEDDVRSLNNALSQFWSILSILTINKMHQLIDDNELQDSIKVISSIYDSIYFEVDNDPTVIKWLNDTLVPVMTTDFIVDQRIKNEVECEVGLDWASLHKIPNGASLEEITEIIKELYD